MFRCFEKTTLGVRRLYRLVQNGGVPNAALSREEVIEQLMDLFRRLGYDGASLAEFSKAIGLGKSSLYHYFPGGKEEMGRAALARSREWLEELVKASLEGEGNPQERLRRMMQEVNQLYAGGRKLCILGNMALSGGMPDRAAFAYTFENLTNVIDQFVEKLGLRKYSLYVMDYGAPVGYRLRCGTRIACRRSLHKTATLTRRA